MEMIKSPTAMQFPKVEFVIHEVIFAVSAV
jgi:hypothetical protein